jgi:hypothetical protein
MRKMEVDSCGKQGCQIFLDTIYQNRKKCTKRTQNVPKEHKMYQKNTKCTKWSQNVPKVCKIFQMAIKYINIFQSRVLQNLPKLGFLV